MKTAAKTRLHVRSMSPPWPGKIQPESLTPAVRLKADPARSPAWARIAIAAEIAAVAADAPAGREPSTEDYARYHGCDEAADRALERFFRTHSWRELGASDRGANEICAAVACDHEQQHQDDRRDTAAQIPEHREVRIQHADIECAERGRESCRRDLRRAAHRDRDDQPEHRNDYGDRDDPQTAVAEGEKDEQRRGAGESEDRDRARIARMGHRGDFVKSPESENGDKRGEGSVGREDHDRQNDRQRHRSGQEPGGQHEEISKRQSRR